MASRDEREARAYFEDRYGIGGHRADALVEEQVIGAAWGAIGYTTLAQADELHDHLALDAGSRLLDVGTGRGWPGLYLARRAGCAVVATDLPLAALRKAGARAAREGLGERAAMVVASGSSLPFPPGTFDGIVHTDVLC
jgi:cyclopropane fatty-acyl-phospholipid synthase-like methyltransferase